MRFLTILFSCLLTVISSAHAAPPTCSVVSEGVIVYNKDHKVMQYCDGSRWIGMAGAAADTLANLSCNNGEIAKWNGSTWACAAESAGLAALQGTDDPGACTPAKDGLIKYNAANNPPWQYCDGGTTSWLPFRLPQCQNDDTGECTLAALRSSSDPQFTAANLRCGTKLLGVTGTYGSGSSNAFTFTDVTGANVSTLTTASAVTISGIPAGCPGDVDVSGDGNPQISINGGAWGTSGSIVNGDTLAVRLTSSASFSTANTAAISVGSTSDSWTVTTFAADTTPNAFTFADVTGANPNTLTTATAITISGINTSTPVSVSGTGAQISINGGAWVTSGNIINGQTLAVRLTSSGSYSTALSATVDVGGVTDGWSVTTRPANNCSSTTINWSPGCSVSSGAMTHNQTKGVNNTASGYIGTRNLTCDDGTISQSGGSCTAIDPPLYQSAHTEGDCASAGGTVSTLGGQTVCTFSGSGCPSGWTSYSWVYRTSKTCSATVNPGCSPGSCTLPAGWFSSSGARSCGYKFSALCQSITCKQNAGTGVTKVSCY